MQSYLLGAMMKSLLETIMDNEEVDKATALKMLHDAVEEMFDNNIDPETILEDHFGLEPDWVMDFLGYAQ